MKQGNKSSQKYFFKNQINPGNFFKSKHGFFSLLFVFLIKYCK